MDAYIPNELVDGLQSTSTERKSRLRVEVDGEMFPLVQLRQAGFSVATEKTPHLRGYADLYDGARHVASCLIIRAAIDGNVTHYEFKRRTAATREAPCDYERDTTAPVALLR